MTAQSIDYNTTCYFHRGLARCLERPVTFIIGISVLPAIVSSSLGNLWYMCFLGCSSSKDSVNLSLLGTLSSVEPQNVYFACFYNTKKFKFYVLNSLNWYGGEMRLKQ